MLLMEGGDIIKHIVIIRYYKRSDIIILITFL